MTEFVNLSGGRIACDVIGTGPLIVLSHGMGEHRQVYRRLAPLLVAAGYRVVNMDIRGHGESSLDWVSETGKAAISRTDIAGDLIEVIAHFGGPAVIVGHSISGGAATIAAATAPELVAGIVELGPFTLTQHTDVPAMLRDRRYRRGMVRLGLLFTLRNPRLWFRYLDIAYPTKPDDYREYMAGVAAVLNEPGRMAEFMKTGATTPADAHAQLPNIACPALVIMGTLDPDFPDPRVEAEAIVRAIPPGLGRVAMLDGAGHYPHGQMPSATAELILEFLSARLPGWAERGHRAEDGRQVGHGHRVG
ncbi:alpha/beta fold hydrolase [Nocardia sp. SYP-A9097]|uniref:alpha/beta fold hydrolase n=1 Tax=Nocardia sp. SYP-A9097 TaxID=2663237 RepID=UPI00132A572F|nr:alpha/beta hydrolase [Nocardia sp. SYP-A9097]MRH90140.1 alpha/beta fold hydrolase [Nocardia sp. SYP-A9097]